jgi:hypothetical protein
LATEIIEKRDLYTKHYDKGNGVKETVINMGPVHYQDQKGSWKDIILDIEPLSVWEFTHGVTSNLYFTYFYDKTSKNKHLVSFEFKNKNNRSRWVNYKLVDALPTDYIYQDNKFKFIDCFPGVDVEYIVEKTRLKENIILKEKPDQTSFIFTLKSDGVDFRLNDKGEVEFVDQQTKEIIWVLDTPYMLDDNDNYNYGIEYQMTTYDSYDAIELIITDVSFLDTATYPVIIDPTTYIENEILYVTQWVGYDHTEHLHPADDRYTAACGVWGTVQNMWTPGFRIPTTVDQFNRIEKVTFEVLCKYSNASWLYPQELLSDFNRGTNWKSIIKGDYIGNNPQNFNNPDWWIWDITDRYKESISGENPLYGIALRTGWGRRSTFYSYLSSYPPRLVVQYRDVPNIIFKNVNGNILSNTSGDIIKYLDFGIMTAGSTSLVKEVVLENRCGFDIGFIEIWVEQSSLDQGIKLKLSKYKNPFIEEDYIYLDGSLAPGEVKKFYVRLSSDISVKNGGTFKIIAKGKPV